MNILSTDKPKERNTHFKQYLLPYLKLHESSASLVKLVEKVFLYGEEEPSEKIIKKLGWEWWLFLQPEQNEELWVRHFTRIKQRIGKDYETGLVIYSSMGECIRQHLNVNAAVPLEVFGWSHQEDLQYFKFLLGDIYNPEDYSFLGDKTDYPLDNLSMIQIVGWSITAMMQGHEEAIDGKSPLIYPYWKQIVLKADPSVFEPESVFEQNSNEVDAKMRMARMVLQAMRPDYCKSSFKESGKISHNGIISCPLSIRNMNPDEFWDYPKFVEFRAQFLGDIDNGVYPESIQRLKHWASRPESDPDGDAGKRHTSLLNSTEDGWNGPRDYEDPWLVKIKEKKSNKAKKPISGLTQCELDKLRDGIERYRIVLSETGVPGFSGSFDTEEKLVALTKRVGRISKSKAVDRLKDLLMHNLDDEFDVEMLYFLVGEFIVELAAAEEDDAVDESTYIREAWKDFSRAINVHCSKSKVSTRKVKGKIRVTLDAQSSHEYFYSTFDGMGKKLTADMRDFIVKETLPWRLHAIHHEGESGTTEDGNTVCFYLPEGCAVWF